MVSRMFSVRSPVSGRCWAGYTTSLFSMVLPFYWPLFFRFPSRVSRGFLCLRRCWFAAVSLSLRLPHGMFCLQHPSGTLFTVHGSTANWCLKYFDDTKEMSLLDSLLSEKCKRFREAFGTNQMSQISGVFLVQFIVENLAIPCDETLCRSHMIQ